MAAVVGIPLAGLTLRQLLWLHDERSRLDAVRHAATLCAIANFLGGNKTSPNDFLPPQYHIHDAADDAAALAALDEELGVWEE